MNVRVERFPGGVGEDVVADEEPLEIRVEGVATAVTMRTPGDDLDLVAGFLWTEGVIDGADDLRAMAEVGENVVDVRLAEGVPTARARSADRALYATSSCGICGKASLDRIRRDAPALVAWEPEIAMLLTLADRLRAAQSGFASTGGTHAAGLFDSAGTVRLVREDIGRHNAVDKVLGAALRAGTDVHDLGLVTTSRGGFEILQKALVAGVSVVVVMGAPTSLAVEAATGAGMRLYGWLRADRVVRYG